MFPFSTKKPSLLGAIISFGLQGQVNETTGTPQFIASISTIPNPSNRELSTNIEFSQYFSLILDTAELILQYFSIFKSCANFIYFSLSPLP